VAGTSDRPELEAAARELGAARFALLFGSGADPVRLRADSDFDFAVDFGAPLSLEEQLDLAARLARATHRDCDIVDLVTAGPIVRMEALRRGVLVTAREPTALAAFRARTPGEYEDFKRERVAGESAMIAGRRS
jgi:predicted nucleotidyltransferase